MHNILQSAFIAALFCALPLTAAFAGDNAKPIARVGDEIITAEEFEVNLAYRLTAAEHTQGRSITPNLQFRVDTLQEVIDARILRMLAKNAGIEADPEEVQEEFAIGVMRLGGPANLPRYLEELKLTEDGLMEEIRHRMLVQEFIEDLAEDIEVADGEIETRYEKLRSEGKLEREKTTVDFVYILVRPKRDNPRDIAIAKDDADRARKRLLDGDPPRQVAREFSNDAMVAVNEGIYREIQPEVNMLDEVAQQLAGLDPGDATEPFLTADGWHVIQLLQRNEPGTLPLERTEALIEALIFEEKKAELVSETIKKAKSVIRVEIYPAEMQEADAPPEE